MEVTTMQFTFKNNMVWMDFLPNSYKKITIGEWAIDNPYTIGYSSNTIDKPIADISDLRPDGFGKFKYATDFPEYRANRFIFNHRKEDYTVVFWDLENLNGVNRDNIENRQITAYSFFNKNKVLGDAILLSPEDELKYIEKTIMEFLKDDRIVVGWNLQYDYELLKDRYEFLTGSRFPELKCIMIDYQSLYSKYVLYKPNRELKKLQDALTEQGIEGKVQYDGHLDDLLKNDPEKYRQYSERDTEALYELDQKCKLLDLIFEICDITGCMIQDVCHNSRIIETFIYNFLKERGKVFCKNNYENRDDDGSFEGATVFDPIVGLHRGCRVYDLNSLYPYVMINWNISPETYGTIESEGYKKTPVGTHFDQKEKGMLPIILEHLIDKRQEVRAAGNDVSQHAYKLLANTIYGVFGTGFFRLSNKAIAESITGCARHLTQFLKNTLDDVLGDGTVLYGDTDSIMVKHKEDLTEAINDHIIPHYYTVNGLDKTRRKFAVKDEYGIVDIMFFPIKKTYIIRRLDGRYIYKNIFKSNRIDKAMEFFITCAGMVFDGNLKSLKDFEEIKELYFQLFELTPEWLNSYSIKKNVNEYKTKQAWMRGLVEFEKLMPLYKDDLRQGVLINVVGDYKVSAKTGKRLKSRDEFCLACPDGVDPQKIFELSGYELDTKYYRNMLFSMCKHLEPIIGGME